MKTNYRYLYENDLTCRGCKDPLSVETVEHVSQLCVRLDEEREEKPVLEDVFRSLDKQINFIQTFKPIAMKWKLIIELEASTI